MNLNFGIDSALSWEWVFQASFCSQVNLIFRQLTASDVNFAILRPLVMKYAALHNLAIVYSCLVVRSHFLRLSDENLAHSNLNNSRAMLCELLAIKFLRHFASNHIQLVAVLTHSWNPLAGAPAQTVDQIKKVLSMKISDELNESSSALEVWLWINIKSMVSHWSMVE